MIERIKKIIEKEGLQSSAFADKINVSRGTVSHILNGRNEPSRDTIDKILKIYPDISSTWLLSGEGPMYTRERVFLHPSQESFPIQPDLFNEKSNVNSTVKPDVYEYPLKNEVKKPDNIVNSPIIQEITPLINTSKKIDKIMIFYSDKTFMSFIPEE